MQQRTPGQGAHTVQNTSGLDQIEDDIMLCESYLARDHSWEWLREEHEPPSSSEEQHVSSNVRAEGEFVWRL